MSAVAPRVDEVVSGLWRLRLPLIWEEIGAVSAWAIADGAGGCVLVDCGMAGPGYEETLAAGLETCGFSLEGVGLLAITHCHGDHYGLAGAVVDASGCELWMHPDHAHMTREREDIGALARRRVERGRRAGVPDDALELCGDVSEEGAGVVRTVLPDRPLVEGVELETAPGRWVVVETPGHAPSHVCLFQPERRLLISGDHLLPGWAPWFDQGYTTDPVGQFLAGLDRVEALEAELVLPGHGRAFPDGSSRARAFRAALQSDVDAVRRALAAEPASAWELACKVLPEATELERAWGLVTTLCYLEHLEGRGEAKQEETEAVTLWRTAG